MPYSREYLVSELLSYYEFLVRLYLSPDQLKLPPMGGWPTITPERFSALSKNENVIDLMQHAPYIKSCPNTGKQSELADQCICIDYAGPECQKAIVKNRDPDDYADPGELLEAGDELEWVRESHIVALGRSPTVDVGNWIFCDTDSGETHFVNFIGTNVRTFTTLGEFFAGLKDDLLTLRMAPVPRVDRVKFANPERTLGARMSVDPKEIFWRHGWPSEDYQKDKCVAEIETYGDW